MSTDVKTLPEARGPRNEAQDALSFAYMYGYPLLAFGKMIRENPKPTTNSFHHSRGLITADFDKVVRLNSDTLYSTILIDLSCFDLSFAVPKIDDRYWAFSFYDLYANNFANIGSQKDHEAGQYLLRFTNESFGLNTDTVGSEYKASINFPTPYGIFLARILVRGEDDDYETVHRFQDAMALSTVPRTFGAVAPPFDLSIFREVSSLTSEEEQVLRLTAALSPYNQPTVLQDRGWVASMLAKAGIQQGVFTQPRGTSLIAARDAANASVAALRTNAAFMHNLGNGWTTNSSLIQGNFGSFYQSRYSVAVRGYLQLTSEQTLYVYNPGPGLPEIEISPQQACLLTFSSKPKVNRAGFWSVTVYQRDHFLVQNRLNRSALGDRSNLKYPDGTPLSEGDRGKFHLLIQPSDVEPPANWTDNWLPAPTGGGQITLTLRVFAGARKMVDGSYQYPELSIIDAITP